MAPTRVTRANIKGSMLPKLTEFPIYGGSKRAAERSPPKKQPNKRPALGDVTNRAINEITITEGIKKSIASKNPIKKSKKTVSKKTKKTENSDSQNSNSSQDSNSSSPDITSSQSSVNSSQNSEKDQNSVLLSSQDSVPELTEPSKTDSKVSSDECEKSKKEEKKKEAEKEEEDEVYHDTVESLSPERENNEADDSILLMSVESNVAKMNARNNAKNSKSAAEMHIEDVDAENRHDIYMVSDYAYDIFNYYKDREAMFRVGEYMTMQTDISNSMRAIVVDWMVEVQENFELNHETLYMAIRLVDLYLTKQKVSRDKLQLVAATALFISCKFDERVPPVLDDFLYVCDDAYKRDEYIQMEMNILREVGFDIGMPSSYRFLRRYAKCGKITLDTLTLARYILETSQMQYDYLTYRDSLLAAACLLLALRMKQAGDWTPTLAYYSGYKLEELLALAEKLNTMVSLPPYKNLQTIKTKYSHKVFFEVAKTPALDPSSFKTEEKLQKSGNSLGKLKSGTEF